MKLDYLIIGSGIYGAMFAYHKTKLGKSCMVLERSAETGGFCRTEKMHGIDVHKFGAHIFRTDRKDVWDFVNTISEFVPFVNSPIARNGNETFNLPFNMNTFHQLFGVNTPDEAKQAIRETIICNDNPKNLEEYCLATVGKVVYEKLIRDYTEKQWGRKCTELPPSVMGRIPVRFKYDNNYYDSLYQGVPVNGYSEFIEKLLDGVVVMTQADYLSSIEKWNDVAETVIFTGAIDEFFDYRLGRLEWRSVSFQHRYIAECDNYQGVAVVNYTDKRPYTRSIEHKHFVRNSTSGTVVTYETPSETFEGGSPCYPIIDKRNADLYNEYKRLAAIEFPNVQFKGRLGEYRYYSMSEIIEQYV